MSAVRLADKVPGGDKVVFNVKARMEERERRSGRVSVGFALSVGTRPSVVKFEVEGTTILEGKDARIDKMLEVEPETQIPLVFRRVYQHVFMSIYLLASLIDAPYPPPNLLLSGQQQTPTVQMVEGARAPEQEAAAQSNSRNKAPQGDAAMPEATAQVLENKMVRPEKTEVSPEA